MHPTLDEQLEGIARLIERAAERHPDDPSVERLRSSAGTLRRIAGSWGEMLPFFSADNDALMDLFGRFGADLPEGVAARVEALDAEGIDTLSVGAAHERNKELRALLTDTLSALPPGDLARAGARADIASYLRERIARDPSSGRRAR